MKMPAAPPVEITLRRFVLVVLATSVVAQASSAGLLTLLALAGPGWEEPVIEMGVTAIMLAPVVWWLAVRPLRAATARDRQELIRSEAALRDAQRIARVGSWEWDARTDRMTSSPELVRTFGPAAEGATRAERFGAYTPESVAKLNAAVDRALRDGSSYEMDLQLRPGQDGCSRWMTVRGEPVHDREGRAVGIRGTAQDITERKRVTLELTDARQQLQLLSRRLMEVQEADRRQLARELHDELGQVLTAAKIALQSLEQYPDAETLGRGLEHARLIIDRALHDVRSLSLHLRPPVLDDLGLAAALRWLVDEQRQRTSFDVQLRVQIDHRHDPALETACFRIAQEALTNVVKHACARAVAVDLLEDGAALLLRIRDDGIGFDVAEARRRATGGRSVGLLGMEERAALAGGSIAWMSAPGAGTEVRATFPLERLPEGTACA